MWSDALPVVVPAFGLAVFLTCSTMVCLRRQINLLKSRVELLENTAAVPPSQPSQYYQPVPLHQRVYYYPPAQAPVPSAPPEDTGNPRLV